MKMKNWMASRAALVAILAATISLPAQAQQFPRAEVFGGFSYAHVNLGPQAGLFIPTDRNYYGIHLAVSFNPHKNIRLLLLDLGIQQGGTTNAPPTFQPSILASQALFGPQFTVRDRKATGFAHALIGVTNTRLVETLPGGFVDAVRQTNLAFGFGGGLDVHWTRSLAIRVFQADYVPTRLSGTWENHFRVSTGVVFTPTR